jgi:N-acetyl sugar amidotransferase|tara:strand:+ start:518 stop:1627 length:1110 start_codon:yes stop_codon:yes gene_type:complete
MSKKVFWCKKCVVMSTRPRVTFNEEGVCSACQWAEEKKTLNWEERQKRLDKLLREQKSNPHFQCINAVSGGKDGSYVSYCLKHKKKVRSLAVTVRPDLEQETGKRNIVNFVRSGYEHIHITPDSEAMRVLNRLGFIELGYSYYGWQIAIHTVVMRIAMAFNIPLIFYSEDGDCEYGGDAKHKYEGIYGIDYQISNYVEGDYFKILKMSGLNKDQLYWFTYPSKEEILKSDLKITHWGFYENWDPYRNYEVAKKYCNLEENETLNAGTYTNFGQTDQKFYLLHVYLMYLKFGFGRTNMDAGIDVRRGAMSREQAVQLVKMYDARPPEEYYDEFCDYYKMTRQDFLETLDKWVNKDLFEKRNRWVPKFEIK